MRNCLLSLDNFDKDGSPLTPNDTFSDTIDETWGRGPIMIEIDDITDSKGNSFD